MSGRIGGLPPDFLSVSESINSRVAGKQATRQEECLYPQRQGLHPLWMVRRVSAEPPPAEVGNTVRLANVSVSLYWSRFDALYIKSHTFRNGYVILNIHCQAEIGLIKDTNS